MAYPSSRLVSEGVLAASVLAQGTGLAWLARVSGFSAALFIGGAVAMSSVFVIAWRGRKRVAHLDTLLVTAGLGGLGMFLGTLFDGALNLPSHGASMPLHHVHQMSVGSVLWSWMTVLMFLFCVPACLWLCDQPCRTGSRAARVLGHVLICGCMLGGMLLGGAWLGPLLDRIVGSPVIGAHMGMIGGMVGGAWLGLWIVAFMWPRPKARYASVSC